MNPRLSYIIPTYNAADCICKCLDSIYLLPIKEDEFEVIVVDDCSPDNTLFVVKEYAAKHSNLVVLHQEVNQRQGAARNRGIEIAKGEYIAFCDADDVIVSDGVMNALDSVSHTKADICYFDFMYERHQGEWLRFSMPERTHNTIICSKEYLENYYTCWFNAPWRCLYRSRFLKNTGIHFVEGVRWEDCDWTVKVYAQANTIQFVDGVGYRYCFNGDSTSRQNSPRELADKVFAGTRLMVFGREIMCRLPRLSEIVYTEGKNRYVVEVLRLRNLTKYSFHQIKKLYRLIGEDTRTALLQFNWPFWVRFFLRSKEIAFLFLSFACPSARLGRSLLHRIRIIRG